MRELTNYKEKNGAQSLADALEVAGIEAEIRQDSGKSSYTVWILDDDQVEEAEILLTSFDSSVDHSVKANQIRSKRKEDKKNFVPLRRRVAGEYPIGILTMVMIVISIVVGFASELGNVRNEVTQALLVVPVVLVQGDLKVYIDIVWEEGWRLLTPMFLHFSVMHLVFNMFWLHHLGNQIESIHGTFRFLLLVVLSMLPGALAQFELAGPIFGGMSGVNYGLFGFVWMQARYGNRGYGIENREVVLLMGWFVLCATGVLGPIANAAHSMGLIVGIMAGLPAYFSFRKEHKMSVDFSHGSWADVNIKGWKRFEKKILIPFMPFWFLIVAFFVLWVDG